MAVNIEEMIQKVQGGTSPSQVMDEAMGLAAKIGKLGAKAMKSQAVRSTARTAVKLARSKHATTALHVAGAVLPGKAGKVATAAAHGTSAFQDSRRAAYHSAKAGRSTGVKKVWHKASAATSRLSGRFAKTRAASAAFKAATHTDQE